MMHIVKRFSLPVVQAVGSFFFPWPKLVRKYFSRRIQASIFGILVSLSVFVLIWILFVGQNSLSNRTIASVLIAPNLEVINAGTAQKEINLFQSCRAFSAIKPREIIDLTKNGSVCRGWEQIGESPNGTREWIASKYQVTRFSPRITRGHSRTDALGAFLDPFQLLMRVIFLVFCLFLICQTGFFSYRRFLNREEKTDKA